MKRPNNKAKLAPGKRYHIYTRGNNKEDIFKEPANYAYFLKLWKKHITPIADTFAYCLLKNHIHFCVGIKYPEDLPKGYASGEKHLSKPFSNCFNAYAKAINKRFERTGSLFEETFQRIEIEDEIYFLRLIAYIHANPQHHRFVKDFRLYPHSSYQSLISDKPTSLKREEVLDYFGGKEAFLTFHADHHNWRTLLLEDDILES